MTDNPTYPEGWAFPTWEARKAHYFEGADARSLCGKWRYSKQISPSIDGLTADTGPGPDDCAGCRRKLDGRRAP